MAVRFEQKHSFNKIELQGGGERERARARERERGGGNHTPMSTSLFYYTFVFNRISLNFFFGRWEHHVVNSQPSAPSAPASPALAYAAAPLPTISPTTAAAAPAAATTAFSATEAAARTVERTVEPFQLSLVGSALFPKKLEAGEWDSEFTLSDHGRLRERERERGGEGEGERKRDGEREGEREREREGGGEREVRGAEGQSDIPRDLQTQRHSVPMHCVCLSVKV
jgi:hypothetical protein